MTERLRLNDEEMEASDDVPIGAISFVSTGSKLLDLALGGGWAIGRIVNIVGDKSTGKSLLAIEAAANFALKGDGQIRYSESEFAFDEAYAHSLGLPTKTVITNENATVEDFTVDLTEFLSNCDPKEPNLYIQDSLDALSDAAELEAEFDKASYGTAKAKVMSRMFRQLTGPIERANCTLLIISQTRDKIGVMFGEKKTRSGGNALNFYSSQIVWLSEIGKLDQVIKGQKRIYGVNIKAQVKKCKTGMPFREAEFPILFGYGVDDEISMIEFLSKAKVPDFDAKEMDRAVWKARDSLDREALSELRASLQQKTAEHWAAIEDALRTRIRKYE